MEIKGVRLQNKIQRENFGEKACPKKPSFFPACIDLCIHFRIVKEFL